MRKSKPLARRAFLSRAAAGASLLPLAGCDQGSMSAWFDNILDSAESVTRFVQRAITGRNALAPEYSEAELSKHFRANGTTDPEDSRYQTLAKKGFADWRLEIGGLVERPMRFSLAELRAFPAKTQITRHDCVEGWSCIGKWTGVHLGTVLDQVKPKPSARYVMFYSADPMEQTLDGSDSRYYESIDLAGAYHPQTILAYAMNDATLPIPYGAPLRLRDERQLGYKMAKYIMRIELVESFANIRGGKGGYWEDQGYEWYAGI
ncbi:MAG TPA: molybdopterin-binding protein [Stellaceae bacterium]|jgi:DMSO/TMAO reductase YedYZ molybdopterin-dependent catalytic subunit